MPTSSPTPSGPAPSRAAPPQAGLRPPLSKDTRLCISLAGRPSNVGTRFHNHLYDVLGLDYIYKAFTTDDIASAIGGVRALGIRGCSVSMPYKSDVLALVDEVEQSAAVIGAVNTIVNDVDVPGGHLVAANTDYLAVRRLIAEHRLDPTAGVLIRGSGGMAAAVAAAFRDTGFDDGTIVARNGVTGAALAERVGYRYAAEPAGRTADVLVNVTPIGMSGAPEATESAFDAAAVAAASVVFDVVAVPSETPLVIAARAAGVAVVTGAEVIALQAAEQFERYTGVRPTAAQVAEASAISRA